MRIYRPAARIAAVCAATALALVAALPGGAATGTGWQIVSRAHFGTSTAFNGLFALAATSSASAWAVGGEDLSNGTTGAPLAERWDGTTWQPAALPAGLTDVLDAVSAPATNDAWAVSALGGYALHWDGTTWSVAKTWREPPLRRELSGVTAFSPRDVWVFGSPGAFPGLGTWHFNGNTWHHVTGPGGFIFQASALSRRNMWAIGSDSVAPDDTIVHFNGSTWQQVTSPALNGLQFRGILALSASNIWTLASVTGGPTETLVHFDGQQWSTVPVTVPSHLLLTAMASDGHGGLWFAGSRSFSGGGTPWVAHRPAAGAWTSRKLASGPGSAFDITHIPGTKSLWAAGNLQTATGADAVVWGKGPAT